MNKNFALLLAALIPLTSGCIDDVPLADRSDGGAGDVPATDAPPMDAPGPSVCAACGGVDSPSCLYAPGCGAPQRVCAANTCGDAVALLACGCDGRTFVTGCITPDRPYQHTGACSDGGPAPQDGGPVVGDAPSTDAPTLAFCPVEVDYNAAQNPTFRYRRAAFAIPPDSSFPSPDGGVVETVDGVWLPPRVLATPMVLGCEATDARPECLADVVIRVLTAPGPILEYVVPMTLAELPQLPRENAVTIRARASRWDGATPVYYQGELTVRRAVDGALLLAIATNPTAAVGISVDRGSAVCRSRPEPLCRRVLQAHTLNFSLDGQRVELAPGASGTLITPSGRFTVRNRLAYQRVPSGGTECSDVTPSVTSFEIVRQP